MKYLVPLLCILLFSFQAVQAQTPEKADFWSFGLQSMELFQEMLSIPNDAHHHDDLELNIKWTEKAFASRGFQTTRLKTASVPLVLAEKKARIPSQKTVLVYLQMDGQPVDPSFWYQDDPFKAVLKEQGREGGWDQIPWASLENNPDPDWRIFARSTSDAKGPVVMFLTAMDMLDSFSKDHPFNLKVIIDFEEEIGSPQLPEAVKT
ncbi:MAG: M20/M25/M40 family metallo-hydrolase, partial [Saprospiraceae bacterium]|nr:M20/M25/M40 family metallo-hydrolase [Saprospiraceae bacterium]